MMLWDLAQLEGNMISNINISNAYTLSQSTSFESFGGTIGFHKKTSYVISCIVSDITNEFGNILSYNDLIEFQGYSDYNVISINSIIIQRAKITSFSIESGNWNKIAKITLNVEIIEELDNLSSIGDFYKDLESAFSALCCKYIESISENISLNNGENSSGFTKEITIKFSNSINLSGTDYPIVRQAQIFAKKMFDYDASSGYRYLINGGFGDVEENINKILKASFKRLNSERFDLINNVCVFTENISAYTVKTDYSCTITSEFIKDSNGITTVSENGTIKGLTDMNSAENGFNQEINNAEQRLKDLYSSLNECQNNLILLFTLESKTINSFKKEISYRISATDDQSYKDYDKGVKVEEEISFSNNQGILELRENVTIIGLSDKRFDGSSYVKYNQAKTFLNSYQGVNSQSFDVSLTSIPTDRSQRHSFWKGEIQVSKSYSSNPIYKEIQNGIKTISITNNCTDKADYVNFVNVINNPILLDKRSGKTQISQNISVDMLMHRINPNPTSFSQYEQIAKQKIQSEIPNLCGSSDVDVINSATSNFSYFNDVSFNFSVSLTKGMESA